MFNYNKKLVTCLYNLLINLKKDGEILYKCLIKCIEKGCYAKLHICTNRRSGEILRCNPFNKQDHVMKIFNVCVSKVLHLIDQRRDSASIFKSALLVLFSLIQQIVARNSVIVYNKRAFSFKFVYFDSNYSTFVRIQTEILAVKFSV